jgi:hypothetical protein
MKGTGAVPVQIHPADVRLRVSVDMLRFKMPFTGRRVMKRRVNHSLPVSAALLSLLQHTTNMLTVGACGNDMAAPGIAIAAASSAASETLKLRISASLCLESVMVAFMSLIHSLVTAAWLRSS